MIYGVPHGHHTCFDASLGARREREEASMRKHLLVLLFAVALFLGLTAAALPTNPSPCPRGVAMKGAAKLAY
jgi:hypothetical protein